MMALVATMYAVRDGGQSIRPVLPVTFRVAQRKQKKRKHRKTQSERRV
jgi:hypothetical protein